jgi:hypothetical protein
VKQKTHRIWKKAFYTLTNKKKREKLHKRVFFFFFVNNKKIEKKDVITIISGHPIYAHLKKKKGGNDAKKYKIKIIYICTCIF